MKLAAALAASLIFSGAALAQDKPAAAPAKGAAAKEKPVAKVNGVAVPASHMDFLLQQQKSRGAPDNDQTRNIVRDELVNRELVAQEAQRAGFSKKPEVQTQVEMARQEILVGAYLRDWVAKHPVSDAEIQQAYDEHKAQAGSKEYRARHILVDNEDQAKQIIAELKKGGDFAELAKKNSKDPGSKDRGGDLDWNVPAAFDKNFSDAMVSLEKGKFTETPVQTRFGYHIIRLDDVRDTRFPTLAEVRPRLQQQLTQQKVDELVRGLRAKAKVE